MKGLGKKPGALRFSWVQGKHPLCSWGNFPAAPARGLSYSHQKVRAGPAASAGRWLILSSLAVPTDSWPCVSPRVAGPSLELLRRR